MTGVVVALPVGATGADAAARLAAAADVVPDAAVPLPLLLLLAGPADEGEAALESVAKEAAGAAARMPATPFAAVRAVSIAAGAGTSGGGGPFSEADLLHGLRWLAERAPPQPRLEVCPFAGGHSYRGHVIKAQEICICWPARLSV